MKKILLLKKSLLAASIAALISGNSLASTSTMSTISGVVTGLDSVTVNGAKYDTSAAAITIDGTQSLESQLNVGDVVVLQKDATGSATSISSSNILKGYTLDTSGLGTDGTGSINVMGQTVNINLDTVFDSASKTAITDLTVNDIVAVQGFSDGKGTITATRIETKTNTNNTEVKGRVSGLDTANMTFTLGDLKVNYSNASELPASLSNGQFVQAATLSAPTGDLANGLVMDASKVIIEKSGSLGSKGDKVKVQGVVSDITETSFNLNGLPVDPSSLKTDKGLNLSSLLDGMLITAEGTIGANGELIVKKIKEKLTSEQQISGSVMTITETTISIANDSNGELTTFTINNDTRLIDKQDQQVTPVRLFSLSDMATGDFAKVDFSVDSSTGDIITTGLTRDDASQASGASSASQTTMQTSSSSSSSSPDSSSSSSSSDSSSGSSSSDSSSCSSSSDSSSGSSSSDSSSGSSSSDSSSGSSSSDSSSSSSSSDSSSGSSSSDSSSSSSSSDSSSKSSSSDSSSGSSSSDSSSKSSSSDSSSGSSSSDSSSKSSSSDSSSGSSSSDSSSSSSCSPKAPAPAVPAPAPAVPAPTPMV